MMKRCFDVVSAGLGLILLSPLFLVIGIWIKLDSPGEVFFRQVRVGRRGAPFRIFKFRTMRPSSEAVGQLTVANDMRVTRVGRWLRKYKFDELPQLINVVFGDMSIVGPRPEVPKYVAHYTEAEREKVLSVRPGITDRASIEFVDENDLLSAAHDPERTYVEKILPIKIRYYLEYADRRSFGDDLLIVFATLEKIIGVRHLKKNQ